MVNLLVYAREEEESEEVRPFIPLENKARARTELLMAINKITDEKLKK